MLIGVSHRVNTIFLLPALILIYNVKKNIDTDCFFYSGLSYYLFKL